MTTTPTLKDLREAAGLSPREAAAQCQVTVTTWYNWENGRKNPSFIVYVGIRTVMAALSPK